MAEFRLLISPAALRDLKKLPTDIQFDISRKKLPYCAMDNILCTRSNLMGCVKTKIFKSNRSQAVRLPKEVAFSETDLSFVFQDIVCADAT